MVRCGYGCGAGAGAVRCTVVRCGVLYMWYRYDNFSTVPNVSVHLANAYSAVYLRKGYHVFPAPLISPSSCYGLESKILFCNLDRILIAMSPREIS